MLALERVYHFISEMDDLLPLQVAFPQIFHFSPNFRLL